MTFVMANVPVKTIQDTFKREVFARRQRAFVDGYDLSGGSSAILIGAKLKTGDGLSELDRLHARDGAR